MNNSKYDAIKLKKKGITISEIAKKLKISERSVNRYTEKILHPNNPKSKDLKSNYKKLTQQKAEIIGYIASEGSCYFSNENYMESRKNRKNLYRRIRKRRIIEFSNKNTTLLKHFKQLIKDVYGYNVKIREVGLVRIRCKEIINDLTRYATYGSSDWKLFKNIINAERDIKRSFCRAYFDGDGTVDKNRYKIILDSVNYDGLKQMKKILKDLEIESKIYKYRTRSRLVIKDIHSFKREIDFLHPTRKASLIKIIGARGEI